MLDPRSLYLRSMMLKRDEVPSFRTYPFNLPAVHDFVSLSFRKPVTFIVGENGSGKSTLLEAMAIAWGFNPEGGTNNFAFETMASHSELYRYLRLVRGAVRPKDGFFSGRKVITTWRPRLIGWTRSPAAAPASKNPTEASRCMSSHTAKAFSLPSCIVLEGKDFT